MSNPPQPPNPYPGQYPGPYPANGSGNPQDMSLHLPAYGVGLGTAVKRAFRKYVAFGGRASLSEYWWMVFFNSVASFALFCFFMAVGVATTDTVNNEIGGLTVQAFLLWGAFSLAVFIPTLAVTSRRLHDANFSGALAFLQLVPGVGPLVVAILCMFPTSPAGARFDVAFHPGFGAYPPYQG